MKQPADLSTLHYTPAVTCGPDEPVAEAAAIMAASGAGSVVVVDEHAHLVGVLTDRDIVLRTIAEGRSPTVPVRDVMTSDVQFVYDSEDVATATTRMLERQCRRLPVLDANGSVIGVVSLDDLLQVFARQVEMLATIVGHAAAWDPVPQPDPVAEHETAASAAPTDPLVLPEVTPSS